MKHPISSFLTTTLLALSLSSSLLFSNGHMTNNGKTPLNAYQDPELVSLANQVKKMKGAHLKKMDVDQSMEDIIRKIDQVVSCPIQFYQVFDDYVVVTDEKGKIHIFDKKTVQRKKLVTSKDLDITNLLKEVFFIANDKVIIGALADKKILLAILAFNAQTGEEIVFSRIDETASVDIQDIKEGRSPEELSVTFKDGTTARFNLFGDQIPEESQSNMVYSQSSFDPANRWFNDIHDRRDGRYLYDTEKYALTRDGYLIPVADSSSSPSKSVKAFLEKPQTKEFIHPYF